MAGFPMAALDWVILKVVQRCNLNCAYCYVYNRGDSSWQTRPATISDAVLRVLGRRIAEHCTKFQLDRFVVELHGGEPLLLGKQRMRRLLEILRSATAGIDLKFLVQTNGTLLDGGWLSLFSEYGITFGISIDGPPEIVTPRRLRRDGRDSTQALLSKIAQLRQSDRRFDELLGGVLCVVDPRADGRGLVRWFAENGFESFEFLLPDGTYLNPPENWDGPHQYRRFLLEAFEEWYSMGAAAPRVRIFETMLMGLMGVRPELDALGGDLKRLCVIESDGSIGISDVMRICGPGFSTDILSLFRNELADHASAYRIHDLQRLSPKCLQCRFLPGCGGGYLPHRYDGATFANPSIYCAALYGLAERMERALRSDLPASVWT